MDQRNILCRLTRRACLTQMDLTEKDNQSVNTCVVVKKTRPRTGHVHESKRQTTKIIVNITDRYDCSNKLHRKNERDAR